MPMTEADIIEPRNRTASDSGDVGLALLSLPAKRNAMMNVAMNIRMAMMYAAIEQLPTLLFRGVNASDGTNVPVVPI